MAGDWSFQITGIEQLTAELKTVAHRGIVLGMERVATRGAVLVQGNINSDFDGLPPAVATAELVNAIYGEVIQSGGVTTAVIAAHAPADVYAAAVETGTKPHFPPTDALIPWVKLKFHPKTESEARSIAFLVARKISKKGTRGHFMFERASEKLGTEAQGILEAAIGNEFQKAGYVPR